MRLSLICTAAAAAFALATAASAQDAPAAASEAPAAAPATIKNGEWIYSADGSAIGRVDHIQKGKDGASTAAVIYQMRMVYIPLESLTAGPKGYVTSLKRSEVSKLK
jgi:hypothetical protein